MAGTVFSSRDIDGFLEIGAVVLPRAFPQSVAAEARAAIWSIMDADPCDAATWPASGLYTRELGPSIMAGVLTDRVCAGLDQLLGAGRWRHNGVMRHHPVRFPKRDPEWRWTDGGWHIDGKDMQHHVDTDKLVLVMLPLWSDIAPKDGGTVIKVGSYKIGCRVLADAAPDGLNHDELNRRVLPHTEDAKLMEMTGAAGDVAILHSCTMHGGGINFGDHPRMITNSFLNLREKPRFDRPNPDDLSIYERSVAMALDESSPRPGSG